MQCSPASSPRICITHERLSLKKGWWNRDCVQVPMTSSLIQTSVKNDFASLLNSVEASLQNWRSRERSFSSPHFSSSNSWARGRVTNIFYFETGYFLSKLIFCLDVISHIATFSLPVFFPNFQLFRKLLIFLGDLSFLTSNVVFFSRKYGKLTVVWSCDIWPCGKQCLSSAFKWNCCFE